MTASKLMVNTIVGDTFDMEDTSTALSCANVATSVTAGTAFLIGPNASVRTKCSLFAGLGGISFLAMMAMLPKMKAAKQQSDAKKLASPEASSGKVSSEGFALPVAAAGE